MDREQPESGRALHYLGVNINTRMQTLKRNILVGNLWS